MNEQRIMTNDELHELLEKDSIFVHRGTIKFCGTNAALTLALLSDVLSPHTDDPRIFYVTHQELSNWGLKFSIQTKTLNKLKMVGLITFTKNSIGYKIALSIENINKFYSEHENDYR